MPRKLSGSSVLPMLPDMSTYVLSTCSMSQKKVLTRGTTVVEARLTDEYLTVRTTRVASSVLASTMLSESGAQAGSGPGWKPGWTWAPRMELPLLDTTLKQNSNPAFPD